MGGDQRAGKRSDTQRDEQQPERFWPRVKTPPCKERDLHLVVEREDPEHQHHAEREAYCRRTPYVLEALTYLSFLAPDRYGRVEL